MSHINVISEVWLVGWMTEWNERGGRSCCLAMTTRVKQAGNKCCFNNLSCNTIQLSVPARDQLFRIHTRCNHLWATVNTDRWTSMKVWRLYIHVTVHRNRFTFKKQPDALIIPILFCYKSLNVSGIFSAHHQELSTVYSALVSFMQVFEDRFQEESRWNCNAVPSLLLAIPNLQ
jgi:hypothetical protein